MFANIVLILFITSIATCIFFNVDVIFALLFAMILFFIYCLREGMSKKEALSTMLEGTRKIAAVVITFMIIGILTASWRMSGTIAYIIYKLVPVINPNYFVLAIFLLCSLMSMMIGTSFGTAASMGVICMAIARSMNIDELYAAGAVISGIYLGDRTSPMSSVVGLVCSITQTNLYNNIKGMIKTAVIPFTLTCVFYFFIGFGNQSRIFDTSSLEIFSDNYNLNAFLVFPAISVIVLSLLRINVKIVMIISIVISTIISFVYQKESVTDILRTYVFGYNAKSIELSELMNGGGLVSMLKASIIVLISSSYFGVFDKTDILYSVRNIIKKIAKKFSVFGAMIFTSIFISAAVCNQALTVMLSYQLTQEIQKDKQTHAIDLENSAVLIPALIPWNIAVAIPLLTLDVGSKAILYAFFPFIVPIYVYITRLVKRENI